jgi:hypothetical protein
MLFEKIAHGTGEKALVFVLARFFGPSYKNGGRINDRKP